MTVLRLGDTSIKISYTMLICFVLWAVAGEMLSGLMLCTAVLLHELAHAFVARLLKINTESVTLYPFGGAAVTENMSELPAYEFLIALAGPLFSLFSGFCVQRLWGDGSFVSYSYTVAFLNLLPIFPLDGGRAAECLLKLISGRKTGKKISRAASVTLAALFFVLSIYKLIVYKESEYIISACFLFFAAIKAQKSPFLPYVRLKALPNARRVKIIKAYESEPLISVCGRFYGNAYYLVLFTDKDENIKSVRGEKELLEALMAAK